MGNIVAGSALRDGLQVDNYALLNAAVPAACYDEDEGRIRQTVQAVRTLGLSILRCGTALAPIAILI